jgi:environmental stress-induced protein Ves
MKHLSRRDYRARPWKNGGGVTHEVAVWPEGAGMDDFAWRVSLAELQGPGPFSIYPGVSRSLLLLEGNPVRLEIDGVTTWLDRQHPPLDFCGSANVFAHPDGRALDVGIMSRIGRCRHSCRVVQLEGKAVLTRSAHTEVLMLVEGGPLRIASSTGVVALDRLESLWLEAQDDTVLHLEAARPARLIVSAFEALC